MSILKFIAAFFLSFAWWFICSFIGNIIVGLLEFTYPGSGLPFGLGQVDWARDFVVGIIVLIAGWFGSTNLNSPFKWGARVGLGTIGVLIVGLYLFAGTLHVYANYMN